MAIKGKKSRSKPKGPVRGPRREAVELPLPFLQRRPVQLVFALIAGLLIFWFGVWFTNGLRAESKKKDAQKAAAVKTAQAAKQRLAVQSWKGTVDVAIGSIGTAPTAAGNPTVFADLTAATASIAKGVAPPDVTGTLVQAHTNAKAAEKALNAVDIPTKIVQGKGFDVATTTSLIGSKAQMLAGIDLFAQSVTLAQQAVTATGETRKALGAEAVALQTSAASLFSDGWRQLQEALGFVGIFPAPPQPVPGPTGGLGGFSGS